MWVTWLLLLGTPQTAMLPFAARGRSAVDALPEATARVDGRRREITFELPPVHVPAAHGEHAGMLRTPVHRVDVPVSGSIHQFRVEIADGAGRLLPADRLHHVLVFDPDRRELFVPVSMRLLSASKETGAPSVPRVLFGMPFERGQRLIVSAMLSNPDATPLHNVRLRVVLRYVPTGRPWPLRRAYPWSMDVLFPIGGEGGTKAFDLPPGRSVWWWEGSPAIAGSIVAVGGHLHEYALGLELRNLTTGELIWQARPVTDSLGNLVALPPAYLTRWHRLGVHISPRHRYRVTVVYDNPTGATLPRGGMGNVAGLLVPDDERAWPTVDRASPLYRLDLDNILRNMSGLPTPHRHH